MKRDLAEKPFAYIRGFSEFYKLKFKVTPSVLIPRPETELLVDFVLQINPSSVLDLGTGSGNIAISLAKNNPRVKIEALDISERALKIAKSNAKFHQVEDRITFLKGNLLEGVEHAPEVLAANLPYIPSSRIPNLDPSVKDFEPILALDGGEDGFEIYRRLFLQIIQKALFPKIIIVEIDDTQALVAIKEANKFFPKAYIDIKRDLYKRVRFLYIQLWD